MYQLIGHRGDKENYLENTIEGFKSSLLFSQVSGIELDIQITKDGELMVSHDRYYRDDNQKKYYIHDYYYNDYLKLPLFNNGNNGKFPLLEDVIKKYKELNSSKKILIEIKTLPGSSSVLIDDFIEPLKKIQDLLFMYNIQNNSYIISFDYRIIVESKKQNSGIKTGLILERNLIPVRCLSEIIEFDIAVMAEYWIIKEQVDELNNLNIDVYAWTVNSEQECMRLSNLGVKYMITDKPTSINLRTKG